MSKIAFVNDSEAQKKERCINTSISFRSYDEYLRLKDMDKQDLSMLMQARNTERLERFRTEKIVNSDKFNKALENALRDAIQNELDKN